MALTNYKYARQGNTLQFPLQQFSTPLASRCTTSTSSASSAAVPTVVPHIYCAAVPSMRYAAILIHTDAITGNIPL